MERGRALKRWSIGLLCLGFACLAAFRLAGSGVDADGVLREPFALVPIGWFAISLGLILGAIYGLGRISGPGRAAPRDPD